MNVTCFMKFKELPNSCVPPFGLRAAGSILSVDRCIILMHVLGSASGPRDENKCTTVNVTEKGMKRHMTQPVSNCVLGVIQHSVFLFSFRLSIIQRFGVR